VVAAQAIIAEGGLDMAPVPDGRVPRVVGQDLATHRRIRGEEPFGQARHPYLKRVLGEVSVSAAKADTFLGQRYRRLARRRGKLKAVVAVARPILVIAWHFSATRQPDTAISVSTSYATRVNTVRRTRNLVHRLGALGHRVTLTSAA